MTVARTYARTFISDLPLLKQVVKKSESLPFSNFTFLTYYQDICKWEHKNDYVIVWSWKYLPITSTVHCTKRWMADTEIVEMSAGFGWEPKDVSSCVH